MNSVEEMTLPLYWKVSTNKIYSGKHWSVRNEVKNNFRDAYLRQICGFERRDILPVELEFNFQFRANALDASNCSYMGKVFEDLLVESKVIPGDSPKHVRSVKCSSVKGDSDLVTIRIL